MFSKLKKLLYFPIASYFRYFARMRLQKWNPRIVVVTGSNGKTTLLNMLEAQFGTAAKFSHHANSSFGIPFDILGLSRKTLKKSEWIWLFLFAPFKVFSKLPDEEIYVVEADADRPGEGKFLAEFLLPEVVLWVSTARTHSMNFDSLVIPTNVEGSHSSDVLSKSEVGDSSASLGMTKNKFKTVEEAIAYEYGFFIEYAQKLVVIDGDSPLQVKQKQRTKAEVKEILKAQMVKDYIVDRTGTTFQTPNNAYKLPSLLPEEVFTSLAMCFQTVSYFKLPFDHSFSKFQMPPGRGSVFQGVKDITIIDSSYNSNLSSIKAILHMFEKFPGEKKWAVIGDMLEQGKEEQEEHEKLAELLSLYEFDRVILMGPRVSKYTYPKLVDLRGGVLTNIKFEEPKEVLVYLQNNLQGGETVLFKGARFLEGVIEHLLKNPADTAKLARREKVWEERRKKWGL